MILELTYTSSNGPSGQRKPVVWALPGRPEAHTCFWGPVAPRVPAAHSVSSRCCSWSFLILGLKLVCLSFSFFKW